MLVYNIIPISCLLCSTSNSIKFILYPQFHLIHLTFQQYQGYMEIYGRGYTEKGRNIEYIVLGIIEWRYFGSIFEYMIKE